MKVKWARPEIDARLTLAELCFLIVKEKDSACAF